MLLQSGEKLAIEIAVVVVIGGLLLGIANTPLYPIAIGIGVIAILFVGLQFASSGGVGTFVNFLQGGLSQ